MKSFLKSLAFLSLAVLGIAAATPARAETKYALCVGINTYQQISSLEGCVNDANYFYTNLVTRGGWLPANMKKLTNSQATKNAIRSAISNYAKKAVSGDIFVYQHSSHGGQFYATDDDEEPLTDTTGQATFLCVYDEIYEDNTTAYNDYELAVDLASFKDGVKVVVIVDACHSGGLFKGSNTRAKEAAASFDLAGRVSAIMNANRSQRLARGDRSVAKNLTAADIGWVTAAEYYEYSLDGGFYHTDEWLTNSDYGDEYWVSTGNNSGYYNYPSSYMQGGVFLGAFTWAWWNGTGDTKSGYGDNDGYADAYECWKIAYDRCKTFGTFRYNDSSANFYPQHTNDTVLRSVELGWVGDTAPSVAPTFPSATDSAEVAQKGTLNYTFSASGSPTITYSLSTSVSSSLYTFNTSSGALQFNPGTLSPGTYTFTCTAANGITPNATCTLTVTVTLAQPDPPQTPTVVGSDSFTATWTAVSGASSYELVVTEGAAGGSGPFSLVESASGLTAGEYVILAENADTAMNSTCSGSSSGYLGCTEVTVDNSSISTDDASIIWTLAGDASSCTLFNADAEKFANPTTTKATVGWTDSASGSWKLSMSGDIVTAANAANTSWMLQYNNTTPRFACYSSAQKKLRFFRRDAVRALPRAAGDVVFSENIGNVTSYQVTGLQPATTYSYSYRAIVNGVATPWSDSVTVTTTEGEAAPSWSALPNDASVTVGGTYTLDLTSLVAGSPTPIISLTTQPSGVNASVSAGVFSFVTTASTAPGSYEFGFTADNEVSPAATATLTVAVNAAPVTVPVLMVDDVTSTTAYATWSECTGVTTYTLQLASDNQFTTGGSGAAVLEEDFSDTTGWTLSGTGEYTGAGYSGAAAPALKFDTTGDYAISPDFGSGSSLDFWAYGNNGSGSTFAISGLVNGDWEDIDTVSIAQGGNDYQIDLPSGTSQIRFDFTKNGYNCALDDVVVYGPSGSGSLISSTTVSGTSSTFTGLTPETTYYARVMGEEGWSDVKEFTTLPAGDSAPVWSALPANAIAYVEELYDLTLTDYVTASPAATITLVSATADGAAYASYEYDGSTLVFSPDAMVDYVFNFSAANGVGDAATASLTVTGVADPATLSIPSATVSATVGELCTFDATFGGRPTPTFSLTSDYPDSTLYSVSTNGVFEFIPESTGEYSFTLTAANIAASVSQQFTVTVSEAAVTVPELTVTDVTDTTALASWTACDGVSSYTLQLASDDQFTTGSGGGDGESVELVNEGFDGGTTLPTGWTVESGSIGGTYTSSGNYGASSPSLQLKPSVTFSTPALSNPTNVAFWYKGQGSAFTSTLVVEQYVSGSWTEVDAAEITTTATTFSHALNPSATQVRFVFTKATGNVAFDDVVITGTSGSSGSGSLISSTTVSGTSSTFTGLTPETTYYARVKGNADWSNVEDFTTESAGASAPLITVPQTSYSVTVGDSDVEFTVTVAGTPTPTLTDSCTEGAVYGFENGRFSFEPSAVGTYHFVFTASNSEGSDTVTVTIEVSAAPVTIPTLTVTDITDTTALASWTECTDVTDYRLQLATDAQFSDGSFTSLLTENFDGVSGNATTAIASLDGVTGVSGWTCANTYSNTGVLRLGKSGTAGWIQTPAVEASTTLRVVWDGVHWTNDSPVEVTIEVSADGTALTPQTVTLTGDWTSYTNTFELAGTADVSVKWSTKSSAPRFFIDNIEISGGSPAGGDSGSLVFDSVVTGTSHTFTDLSPYTVYYARVKAEDAEDWAWSGVVDFITDVAPVTGTAPEWSAEFPTTWTLTAGAVDVFTVTDYLSGDPSPTVSLATEATGYSFDGTDFLFQPTATGTFTFTFTAANGIEPDAVATLTVTVTGEAPAWDVIPAQSATLGEDFFFDLSPYVSGTPAPTITVADNDQDGIVVDTSFGCTPTTVGTISFTLTAANVLGSADATLTVNVTAAPEPLSDYQQWLQAHGVATDTSADAEAPNGHTYGQNYIADIDPSGAFLALAPSETAGYIDIENTSPNRYYQLVTYTDILGDPEIENLGPGYDGMSVPYPDDGTFFVRVRALLTDPSSP